MYNSVHLPAACTTCAVLKFDVSVSLMIVVDVAGGKLDGRIDAATQKLHQLSINNVKMELDVGHKVK